MRAFNFAWMDDQQQMRLASDGGVIIPGRASYGWILQQVVGELVLPIAKGKGPAHGDDPCSFQAEGYYDMASGLLYLSLLQYTKILGSSVHQQPKT
jgi:hypothetical protein